MPFFVLVCTAEGLVAVAMPGPAPGEAMPEEGEGGAGLAAAAHCPACLRVDPCLPAGPAVAEVPVPAPVAAAIAPPRGDAAPPRFAHALPDATGPPRAV